MRFNHLAVYIAGSLVTTVAVAQAFETEWYTIDGGAGISTGANFILSGTMGQPDAGALSGGQYHLVGGFFGGVGLIQAPGSPILAIERIDGKWCLLWPLPAQGWFLEQSSSVTGSWSRSLGPYKTNANHISVSIENSTENQFYRLHH